jgi:transposase InsO family protein
LHIADGSTARDGRGRAWLDGPTRSSRGFLYLVAVIDWASRAVLSWRLSNTMDAWFCLAALEEALAKDGNLQHRPGQPIHRLGLH